MILTYEHVLDKTGASLHPTLKNVSSLTELLNFSSTTPIFPEKWLSEDLSVPVSYAQEYLKLGNEYTKNKTNLLDRYEDDILNQNANDIILTIESNVTDVKAYLNTTCFPSNKDIVLRANFILHECQEIRDFINRLMIQSEVISSTLGLKRHNSISSLFEVKGLIDLIIKNPQPIETWFDEGKIKSITELLQIAKNEQQILNDNLKNVREKYNVNILHIDFNEILTRFNRDYVYVFNLISDFNKSTSNGELNIATINCFVDEQVEKIKVFHLFITNALEVSKQLNDNVGIKSALTLNELISLGELLTAVIQNPKPTLAWFDENRTFIIDKIISDAKNMQKAIEHETAELLVKYNKDILRIDSKNMLIRFNTDYSNFLKYFKANYSADKKLLRGFSKEPKNKLADSQLIDLLEQTTSIKEKEQWLLDNSFLITEMIGDSYMGQYTDWEMLYHNRTNFKIIKDYFGLYKIPEQLKKLLLEGDAGNLIAQHSIVCKLTGNNVLDFLESVFGIDVGKQPISEMLEEMQNIINNSIGIKNDCEYISGYSLNSGETGIVTVNDIIYILKSIKDINQTRKWFSDNEISLSENIGKHYKNTDTDWDNVNKGIGVVEQIIEYFDNQPLPNKLVKYLLSYETLPDSFNVFKNDVDDINNKNIVVRLNELINIEDNTVVDLNQVICTIGVVENGINILYGKYSTFSSCSKDIIQFENVMADITLLKRIQEIEAMVENHFAEFQSIFEFTFKGMNTSWDKVLSSLDYANKFKSICKELSLSKAYINKVSCDNNISNWAIEYCEKLREQDADIKMDFSWFADLFDDGEKLYDTSVYSVLDRLEKSISTLSLLEEWIDFRSIRQQCREIGLSEFVEKVEQIGMQAHVIVDTFFKRFYRLWLDEMTLRYPAVYSFRSRAHKAVIDEFNELDKSQLDIARLRILEKVISRLPNTNIATSSVDEVGILKRELSKQRKIMPIRRLFKEIPNLVTALKPCLMMSPLSVSLFLQADGYRFDTVIFDEASQVCTEDAIGAIMRGKQVIIAGDTKQLPPTNFFATTLNDGDFDIDDEGWDDTGAYDSILEEAVNAISERTLKWHYRSRHEHLIAFSNAKIYNHQLITFPSNMDRIPDNGVEYIYVQDGVYDRGGKKHNLKEAKRVAEIVFEHIIQHPNRSLGVVTFSEAQQQAIDSAIRQLRLENSQYEKFFSEDTEHAFFIKNLENVQGDERDTIIFSIGYGKDQNGIIYMNFGPLNRNGGHRRLNVAITRAKYNVKLVGSIHPTDIKIENTNSEGVKMLRQYIEFAINGVSVLQNELNFSNIVNVDSPFEEAVYDFLINNGYCITTQVGCSGYRIDMAVKHPTISGIFVLGIECDGATYHSARTARERDRIRQTVLEDIGWTIYRIWSTDWIKDTQNEGRKLLEAVKLAISNYKVGSLEDGSICRYESAKKETESTIQSFVIVEPADAEDGVLNHNPYDFAYYKETDVNDITRTANDTQYHIANVINCIIEEEHPIHYDLLCKRVATLFGNQKATVKVRNSVENILNQNLKELVIKKGDFCWHKNAKEIKVKIPLPYGDSRAINYISMEELAEAMFVIVGKSFGITKSDLYVVTARVFGFNRTGGNITQSMEKACLHLLESDRVKEIGGKIVL